jgi:hypothetical protein
LNRDHRHGRDQRGGDGALLMHNLNRAGEDYGQKVAGTRMRTLNLKPTAPMRKRTTECHFQRLPLCELVPEWTGG